MRVRCSVARRTAPVRRSAPLMPPRRRDKRKERLRGAIFTQFAPANRSRSCSECRDSRSSSEPGSARLAQAGGNVVINGQGELEERHARDDPARIRRAGWRGWMWAGHLSVRNSPVKPVVLTRDDVGGGIAGRSRPVRGPIRRVEPESPSRRAAERQVELQRLAATRPSTTRRASTDQPPPPAAT